MNRLCVEFVSVFVMMIWKRRNSILSDFWDEKDIDTHDYGVAKQMGGS